MLPGPLLPSRAYEATKRDAAARHADADDDDTRDKTAFLDAAQSRMERWLAGRANAPA